MGNAVDVPRNADRIDKTEDQHDPEWHTGKKIKHAEEVNAVENACRDWNNVPACVRKDLEFVFARSMATNSLEEVRIVFRNACWNTQFSRINPVGNSRSDLQLVE